MVIMVISGEERRGIYLAVGEGESKGICLICEFYYLQRIYSWVIYNFTLREDKYKRKELVILMNSLIV